MRHAATLLKSWPAQLERIRRDLGLDKKCRLRADLHNLLIYGKSSVVSTFLVGHNTWYGKNWLY